MNKSIKVVSDKDIVVTKSEQTILDQKEINVSKVTEKKNNLKQKRIYWGEVGLNRRASEIGLR